MVSALFEPATGGIPIAASEAPSGLGVDPGVLQFGALILGVGATGWRELNGWRDLPDADVSDTPRPQAHGAYPGAVFAGARVVTLTFLLRGLPAAKLLATKAIERYAPMDGVERPLVINDGDGPYLAYGRVIGRSIPQDKHFAHAPLECSLQFLCADPRRYTVDAHTVTLQVPTSSGGVEYPAVYPLEYGTYATGSLAVTTDGSTPSPLVAVFLGPLLDPSLTCSDWSMGFSINLAAGETLTVDTAAGTALLNDTADRLYTITPASSPLELCVLQPGATNLALTAPAGGGSVTVTARDARM